jgi:cytochrome P450
MPAHLVTEVTEFAPRHREDLRPMADGLTPGEPDSQSRSNHQGGDMTTAERLSAVRRYPIAGVCVLLGVRRKDWHLFQRWTRESLTSKALDELYAYVDVMIADRCRKPGADLLSQLIQLEVDGEELTVDDLRMVVVTLVSGAN